MRECFFAFLVFLYLTGCKSDPNGLSNDFELRGRLAFEAIERLEEQSQHGIPRDLYVEAEKAIADAAHAEANEVDHRASVALRYYLTRIERQDLQRSSLLLSEEHESLLREQHRPKVEAINSSHRLRAQLGREQVETLLCHDELSLYFGSLRYVANKPAFGHCAAEFEKDANATIE